jgi:diadenosine tetraphosphate (Ap4A) HIT family hydrolase
MFSLHPQLEADTLTIGELNLSRVLLMNNAELPWLILVPRRGDVSEWHNLTAPDQLQLHLESMRLGAVLMSKFKGDKLNTGVIGNMVPQLHLHHVVRFKHDSVWPLPVWGNIAAKPYTQADKKRIVIKLQDAIGQEFDEFIAC